MRAVGCPFGSDQVGDRHVAAERLATGDRSVTPVPAICTYGRSRRARRSRRVAADDERCRLTSAFPVLNWSVSVPASVTPGTSTRPCRSAVPASVVAPPDAAGGSSTSTPVTPVIEKNGVAPPMVSAPFETPTATIVPAYSRRSRRPAGRDVAGDGLAEDRQGHRRCRRAPDTGRLGASASAASRRR